MTSPLGSGMVLSLPAQVVRASGAPSSVRIGVVTSLSPLTVSIQGHNLNPGAVGVAANINPVLGSSVVLLGQSKASGTDPSSWLIIGLAASSSVAPLLEFLTEGTDQAAFTSTAYIAGTPICGVSFVAPPSGVIRVDWHSRFQTNTVATRSLVSVQVATDAVLDAGVVVSIPTDSSALENPNDALGGTSTRLQAGMWRLVPGLVPGAVYNAVVKFRMATAGNGDIFDRSIMVTPM